MRILFTLVLILFSSLSMSQSKTTSQVHEFKLDNGLKIRVKEDHRAPVVVAMLWYNVGSADEPGGISGVSHALEHLMFKGTPRYPLGVFSKIIAAQGGQENAFTSNDYTAYFEKIANTRLATSFALEADRMQNLLLAKDEFAKEIKVIQEERRLRTDDNPQALTFERFLASAHLSPPYAHPVIGWMSDLEHMTVKDANIWYHRYYTPNNACLVVVGDVNATEVYKLAKKHFAKLKKHPLPQRRQQQEPPCLGIKTVEVHARAQIPLLMLGFNAPSLKSATSAQAQDPYALEILAGLLDAGDSARLTQNLIRGQHIASGVEVSYDVYTRYPTQFMLYGTPSQSHSINELRKSMLAELTRLQNEPVSQQELNRVKTQLIAQKTFEKDSIFGQAMEIGLLETLDLGSKTAENYVQALQKVSASDVQRVAKTYFRTACMTQARLIPIQSNQPARAKP
jgi:zinc protease